jgi:endonuclease YncB( thermonuclease family)
VASMRTAFAILCCLVSIRVAHAEQVQAVPQIVDADTVYAGTTKIRLSGIDAPEMDQVCVDAAGKDWKCGIEAREKLQAFARERPWDCDLTGTDVYRRHLGSCTVGGEDVSRWLVRNGWALAFRRYSTAYVADEDYAREHSAGQCIYHMPGGHFYDRLDMQRSASRRWFCTESEAQAAGCRRSKL